ncbi:MAG: DNA polymerase I [Candidatus Omnitrophica bacterium]|nr:DNA polymerase I [Candidatus Omnitrophota bacterium]
MSKQKTIYLLDGTSLCYRAFYALRLSNSRGFPTGAVYGMYQTLKKIIDKYHPEYLAVCFDVSRKTFRTERYEQYKIQRPPLPDEFKMQIPIIKKMISLLGLRIVEREGFEADDVIASLAETGREQGGKVVIVSSDKDMYQLLDNEKVIIYSHQKDEFISEGSFRKKWGFAPVRMIDYLSLVGDSSDNVPGAKGIGKVGAKKLLKEYSTIEDIFARIDQVPARTRTLLEESRDDILLSKELITLQPCEMKLTLKDLRVQDPDAEELFHLFQEMEFKKLLKDLPRTGKAFVPEVKSGVPETLFSRVGTIALYFTREKGFVYDPADECVREDSRLSVEKAVLRTRRGSLSSYGVKEQMKFLDAACAERVSFDVKIAAYLLSPESGGYDLSSLAARYLEMQTGELPPAHYPYFIGRLTSVFQDELKKQGLDELFSEVEMPLVGVLARMESHGISVDISMLKKLETKVSTRARVLEEEIFSAAGHEFNLNSPAQVQKVFFEELGIPPVKKTKTGYSTNEEVLTKLSPSFPIAESLLEFRQLNKLRSAYLQPLIRQVKEGKGKLHTTFHQTSTQTGRLSSASPNLQNIPVRGEFSFLLRKAFVPSFPEGYLLSCDYSQIELRILAHFSQDQRLMDAFRTGADIHRYTASLLFGKPQEKVTAQQRGVAKRVNFGILYGMSSFGLSRELKISPQEAQRFIDEYFARYPGVQEFIDRIYAETETRGYVRTLRGRRRALPDITHRNPHVRDFARRQAVNTPIQGTSADLIKCAMVNIDRQMRQRRLTGKLAIQIHDELVFDIPKEELRETARLARTCMEEGLQLRVPVVANVKYGHNWADMETLK